MHMRPMRVEDIDYALTQANLEGWAYTHPEFERIFRLPHRGCLVWDEGSPAGFVTSVQCGGTAVIGHLVVSAGSRGRKVGRTLLDGCLAELDAGGVESVLLFSTAQGERLYRSCGFRPTRRVISYGISATGLGERVPPTCTCILPEDLDEVCSIDERVFGDDRRAVLEDLYGGDPDMCFKSVTEGRITGYVFGRRTPMGSDIGPWTSVTGSPADAAGLVTSVLSVQPGGRFDLGLFEDSPLAMGALEGFPCVKRFDVLLMVKGEDRYPADAEGALGIAAFELG